MDAENSVTVERISLLKVPLDVIPQEQLPDTINTLLNEPGGKNLVLLSLWDLLRARRNGEYRTYVEKASIVIPIAKSLVGGAQFLTGKTPVRYMPFDFLVNLLTILERRNLSVYLLGGIPRVLKKAEKNIRQTFPQLRIVGRHIGAIRRQDEAFLLEAIRKAAPSLLMVGRGVHGKERWIARNSASLNSALRIWCSDLFEVFAERRKRPSHPVFDRGLEWMGFCIQKPLRILRIFPYLYYKFLLLIYKIFKR
ncbi:MAG: WecB/TagA/CpsF family glycosyltransferase [Treponema sp.]|nr:WecB/TagA/CpsF family glycosyltransferase [Treponema sp.]